MTCSVIEMFIFHSEHAVSNPINVVHAPQYQTHLMMSPRSIGEQTGIFHQMVENVLSSSPGSINTRDMKFVSVNKLGFIVKDLNEII